MNRSIALGLAIAIAAATSLSASPAAAQAAPPPPLDDAPPALFAAGTRALQEGRAGDAIAAFEALADRGVVDAAASYDRALAYAARVRLGDEVSGDLGRAAHGFEEARDLSDDARLADDAARALVVVRSEVARRRMRAGQPVEVDPSRSLARALSRLLSEDVWAVLCALAAVALGAGLFVRWFGRSPRARLTGGVTAGVAVPVLAVAMAMTLAVRRDRGTLREAVVISPAARPTDERGIALGGATPLPEGARVEIIAERGGASRVRFGPTDAWVASGVLREMARRE
jgi:hypothetical protein